MSPKKLLLSTCIALVVILAPACARTPQQKFDGFIEAGKKMLEQKDYGRALLQFKNAAQVMPKDPEAFYQLALTSLAVNDLRAAIAYLRKATELDPKHAPSQLKLAELMTSTAIPSVLNDAEKKLNDILATSPNNPDALNALAIAQFKLGRQDEAEKKFKEAIEKSPADVRAYMNLALIKVMQKDPAGAEASLKQAVAAAPKSSEAHVVLARFYLSNQRLPDAESELRKALELNPKDIPALMDLGRIQLSQKKVEEADQLFQRVSALPDPGAKLVHPMFLIQVGKPDQAIPELEKLAKADPNDRDLRTRLVSTYILAKRIGDAERVLGEAIKKNANDVDALLQRSEMYARNEKLAEAQRDVDQALRYRPEDAKAHYLNARLCQIKGSELLRRQELNQVLRQDPTFLVARLDLAEALIVAGQAATAIEIVDGAPVNQKNEISLLIKRNWALIAASRYEEARKGVAAGLAQERSGELLTEDALVKLHDKKVAEARQRLEEALQQNPENLQALKILVDTYRAENQPAAGIAKAKNYVAQRPNSPVLQAYLSSLLMTAGDTAGARQSIEVVKKAGSPQNGAPDLAMAYLSLKEGKTEAARQALQTLIAAHQNVHEAAVLLGSIEEAAGKNEEAIKNYKLAVEANDKSWIALNNLAGCLGKTGRNDEALRYAQKAKALAPDNLSVTDTLGWAFYNKGLYDSAVDNLAPLAKSPEAVHQYHLAMAYYKKGDLVRGQQLLTVAMAINRNLPEADMAQQVASEARQKGK